MHVANSLEDVVDFLAQLRQFHGTIVYSLRAAVCAHMVMHNNVSIAIRMVHHGLQAPLALREGEANR